MTKKQKLELTWIGKEKRLHRPTQEVSAAPGDSGNTTCRNPSISTTLATSIRSLIETLKGQLQQQVVEQTLFTIEWALN
ncbi:MAG: hypothetical protein Q8K59_07735 [Nitrosomonas sp.]|nr:hypothetical protein [Nitrosomonas sp.]MDP1950969.1 hypothetical protein [Nitrosomonas sp.]